MERFKQVVYDKYLQILSVHITRRFPDVELLEAFSVFDASAIPDELELQGSHGKNALKLLLTTMVLTMLFTLRQQSPS